MPGAEVPAPQFERPGEDDCLACHPFERPAPAQRVGAADPDVCGLCHPVDGGGRVALPAVAPRFPAVDFEHRRHEESAGAPCEACHDPGQVDGGAPPPMPRCLACHEDAADGGCARCHLHDARGLLDVERRGRPRLVPAEWMGAIAHVADFERAHGPAARTRREVCRSCHEETFCEGCHLGEAIERRFHPAGWISAHGAAGRSLDAECDTCHRGQETCLACHRRSGASLDSPERGRGVPRGTSFHSATWRLDRGEHARDARRNLASCVSCHSARDCLACHARDFSPHGPGFGGRRCGRLREISPETCGVCHAVLPRCD
jgi:hypothetical protein